MAKVKLKYYNFDKLFSYNGIFNFCAGGRGIGKTYGAKQIGIRNAIKRGEQFIYLRRYTKELKSKDTFFADIMGAFPDYDFRVNGTHAEMSHIGNRKDNKERAWKHIGFFIALSTTQQLKSVAYPDVTLIIYDEFILEKGVIRYLPNETEIFTNFFNTVDRSQEKTRVLFLANAVSINNPYFIEYGIEPKADVEFIKKADNFIIAHFPDSAEFQAGVYQTRFGKFIAGTSYADYAVGNQFKDNTDNLLEAKTAEAVYVFTLETQSGTFSIWRDYEESKWYVQEKRPKNENIFTLLLNNVSETKRLLLPNDKFLQILRTGFSQGKVAFDKPKTRVAFIQIF